MQDTCSVVIDVNTEYAREHSDPNKGHYLFIYYIRIRNQGHQAVQLISRHWVITDADGHTEEVRGDGVVGKQPILQPGGEHQYNSFCVLKTSVGCMHGSFQMQGEDGIYFDAPITAFGLAIPGILN